MAQESSSMTGRECIAVAVALLLLAISAYIHFIAGFAGDRNWLLLAARMWLSGKKLYVDIFEITLPLVVWIYALPVALAGKLGFIQDYQILVLMGFGAVACCISACMYMSASHPQFAGNRKKQWELALLLGFVLVLWTNPEYFADREHLFFTLTLPYVLRFMPSLVRKNLPLPLKAAIGVMAAVGFCIKPHCLIVFAGLQLITIVRERSAFILVSIENIIVYAIGALYLFAVIYGYPDYFTAVLPMALATYASYNRALMRWFFLGFCALTFGLTFIDFRWRDTSPYRRDIFYMAGVCALLLAYASVNNGWGYTYYPLESMLLLTTGWVLWEFLYLRAMADARGQPDKKLTFGVRDCLVNFAVNTAVALVMYGSAFTVQCDDYGECKMDEELARITEGGHFHSFGAIAILFHPWPVLERATGAKFETRFNHLWMLPKLIISDGEFTRRNAWIPEYVANALADDMRHNAPDLMFVDASPEFFSTRKKIDLIAYFSVYPAFREAWKSYAYMQSVDYCHDPVNPERPGKMGRMACRYDVYRRKLSH